MRRASPLALAALLIVTASPFVAQPVAATSGVARFPVLPEDSAKAHGKLSAEGRYIVTLKSGKDVEQATGTAKRLGVTADKTFRNAVHGYAAKLTAGQLAALRADPDVEAVVPDEVFSITAQKRPTGVRRVYAQDNAIARINGTDGDILSGERVDADVAIVDTGIDKTHPDLNVAGGISCSTDNPNAWGDPNGHGTHVAGIVGALDNGYGVVGVAPGVRLWAVRILNSAGDGLLSWYVCGLDWITAQRDPLDPTRPLFESVNMSVAKDGKDDGNCGFTNKDVIHKAICRLVSSGVTVVAAAGNNHFNAANLKPASYNEVITVSALADSDGKPGGLGGNLCYSWGGYDQDDTFADFSNYGGDVDLIAPGKCIYSTLPGDRYGYISGTSMAAPLVTGAAALYKASRPLATPAQVRVALRAAGTQDWATGTDPDSVHEPLLDVSHIVAMGDWTLDATPQLSVGTLVGAAGATGSVPVGVVRAEDFAGDVTLTVDAAAPFGAAIDPPTLSGLDAKTATLTFTVPPATATGTFDVVLRATDGTREHTSSYPIHVDSDVPTVGSGSIRFRTGVQVNGSSIPGTAGWSRGADVGSGIAGYEARWRVDGNLGSTITRGAFATLEANRTLTSGHTYSLRVRARDAAGNWSDWSESGAFVPEFRQDTSTTLQRAGGWHRTYGSLLSGGSALYSRNKGAKVTRPFTGRAVALVVSQGPKRGKMRIYVDGTLAGTVDTHRSSARHRVVAWKRTWASAGAHTVTVVVVGTANRPRIDVDTFLIAP